MLNFNDLHDKLAQRKMGLITKENLYSWLDENMEVTSYLPITKKYAICKLFSDKFQEQVKNNEDQDQDYIYLLYDLNCLFTLLFSYTDMIVISKHRTLVNYDLIIESGLYDYILSFCKEDYLRLVEKCDRVTGIDNLSTFMYFSTAIGKQPSVEEFERIKDIVNNELDKDKLDIIKVLQEYNNPMMKKIIDNVSKDAVIEVMGKKE